MRYLFLLLGLLSTLAAVQAQEVVTIGANFGLSGNVAQYGEWATRGITLALEEINEQSETRGRKLEVTFEDSAGSPAKAVTAYHKLRNLNSIQFLLTYQSSIALAIAPLANKDNIVQIDFSATTPLYSSPNDFTFRTGVVATQLAEDIATILADKLGIKEIGCLYIENDFGEGMYRAFQEKFSGTIIAAESFKSEESDYRPQLLKLKKAKVKNIWLVSHLRESGLIVRQARELGMKAEFFSDSYSVEGSDFLKLAGSASEGVRFIAPHFNPEGEGKVLRSFVERYKAEYREDPTYFAAQAYDATRAFAEAMQQCDAAIAACVKKQLYKIDFEGASGRIKFDRNGDVSKETTLMKVERGQFIRSIDD